MPKTGKRARNVRYRPQKKQKHRSKRKNRMIRERSWRSKFPELFYFDPKEIPYWRRK